MSDDDEPSFEQSDESNDPLPPPANNDASAPPRSERKVNTSASNRNRSDSNLSKSTSRLDLGEKKRGTHDPNPSKGKDLGPNSLDQSCADTYHYTPAVSKTTSGALAALTREDKGMDSRQKSQKSVRSNGESLKQKTRQEREREETEDPFAQESEIQNLTTEEDENENQESADPPELSASVDPSMDDEDNAPHQQTLASKHKSVDSPRFLRLGAVVCSVVVFGVCAFFMWSHSLSDVANESVKKPSSTRWWLSNPTRFVPNPATWFLSSSPTASSTASPNASPTDSLPTLIWSSKTSRPGTTNLGGLKIPTPAWQTAGAWSLFVAVMAAAGALTGCCTPHRPLSSRWNRFYRGWRAFEHGEDPHAFERQEQRYELESNIPLPVRDELVVLPRRFLVRPQAINWAHEASSGSFRPILLFRLDWLQVGWILASSLFGLILIGVVHESQPGWWLPFSFYCEALVLGFFLFYFFFRHCMIRRLAFAANVIVSLLLTTLLTHLPLFLGAQWLWGRLAVFALATLFSSFLLLLFPLLAFSLIIGVRVLYEL